MSERDAAGLPEAAVYGHVTFIQQDLQVLDAVGGEQQLAQLVATVRETLRIRVRERGRVRPQRREFDGASRDVVLVEEVWAPEVTVDRDALLPRLLTRHLPRLAPGHLSSTHSVT